jgi:predicted dehydrogenase
MNVIHIGVGIRGRHWLEIVRDDPRFTSVACVDADPAALDPVRTAFPPLAGACVGRLDEALARAPADAAIIASPPPYHADHCLAALEAGLAVLVEKPFTTRVDGALRAVARARELGRPLVVAQNYRFAPAERTVRAMVRQGRIGRLTFATCQARRRRPGRGTFLATMDYPQLMDAAVHHFDGLRSMLGLDALAVIARVTNPPGSDYRHGAVTEALIEMDGGVHVAYLGTLTSHRDEYRLWLEGEHGTIQTDRKRVWWRRRGRRFFTPVGRVPVPKGDALPYPREGTASLLDALHAAVTRGAEPETSGADNVRTLAIVEAVTRSAEESRPVPVAEVLGAAGAVAGAGR